jgi:Sec-independent protein translocase protein TatA
MEIFGIGGLEFLLLFFLGWVLLGPTQVVKVSRDGKRIFNQIRELTQNLSKEVNREIDLIVATEEKNNPESESKEEGEQILPEAYQRFREDFPEEGNLETSTNTHDKKKTEKDLE